MSLLLLFKPSAGGATKDLAGDVLVSSALAAASKRSRGLTGQSDVTTALTGDLLKVHLNALAGSSSNSVTWTAVPSRSRPVAGTASSTTSLSGLAGRTRPVAALLSETSSWTGNFQRIKFITSTLTATSGKSGNVRVAMAPASIPLVGTVGLSATALRKTMRLLGSNTNHATLSADIFRQRIIVLLGSMGTISSVSPALLAVARPLAGDSHETSFYSGLLTNLKPLTGFTDTAALWSVPSLKRARPVSGALSVTSSLQVPGITRLQDLLGTVSGAVSLTSTLSRVLAVDGVLGEHVGLVGGATRQLALGGSGTTASALSSVLSRYLHTLSSLVEATSSLQANVGIGRLVQGSLDAYLSDTARLIKQTPISGTALTTSSLSASMLSVLVGLIAQVGSTSSLAAALRKVAALNAGLNGLATLSATTLRITDDLVALTVSASYQTWEKVDDSTAILVDHVTQPYTFPVRFDIDGTIVDELALSATVTETQ